LPDLPNRVALISDRGKSILLHLARLLPLLLLCLLPQPVAAQGERYLQSEATAGSEQERYLRILQIAGVVPHGPWSLRPLSPLMLDRLVSSPGVHPWHEQYEVPVAEAATLYVLPLRAESFYNTGFPQEDNNGPLWTGRGVTVAAAGGVRFRTGPLTLSLAPRIFLAQNADFDTGGVDSDGNPAVVDPVIGHAIDRPLRFGTGPHARLDAGGSGIRLDVAGVSAGVSSANAVWGPADRYPLILGANAPGFVHAFVGSSQPVGIGVGAVHAQLQWGILEQSRYSPMPTGSRRLMTGIVGVFQPAGLTGLELGAGRFYHQRWPAAGEWGGALTMPFESIFKINVERRTLETEDNQLASVFGRWVLGRSGAEIYAEYAREDHNAHLRDFLLEPDHTSAYTLGLQKVWSGSTTAWWVAQAEVLNATRNHLVQVRFHGPFYLHHALRQGHTHRGQVLGSPAAIGGSGTSLRLDRYDPEGRWTASVRREVQRDPILQAWSGSSYPEPLDVIYSLAAERMLLRGPVAFSASLGVDYNLDRYLQNQDLVNLRASLGGQYTVGRW
jgi:hypothetical protein